MERWLAHGIARKDSFFNPRYPLALGAILASRNYHYRAMKSIRRPNRIRAETLAPPNLHDCTEGGLLQRRLDANQLAFDESAYGQLLGCQNSFHKYLAIQRAILWCLSSEDR